MMLIKLFLLNLLILGCTGLTPAQDDKVIVDESKLPRLADAVETFVPAGWTIEEQISGDLNNDSTPDVALKITEKKSANATEDDPVSRERVLMILFKNADNKFERVATVDGLLQCTGCGGAFFGVVEAPADVKINKGVLIVEQESGSRNVTETTFRFRYDPVVKKFTLIGYDAVDRDRATGEIVSNSSNFLTGVKITEIYQYNQKLDKQQLKSKHQTKIAKAPQYLEDIDYEKIGDDAE